MNQNNKFFRKFKKYTIYSISPFYHLDVEDGVTSRISFICSKLSREAHQIITVMRGKKNKNSFFDPQILHYFWTQNRFIHLFDLRIILFMLNRRSSPVKSILYVHTIWSFFYAIFFKIFLGIPYVFDNHNVEFDRFYSTRRYFLLPFIFLSEKVLIYFAKYVVVGSDSDRNRLIQLYGRKDWFHVVEIKIKKKKRMDSIKILNKYGIPSGKIKLLFFWSFSYYPNKEALSYIENAIIPFLPHNYIFILCGKNLNIPNKFISQALYLGYVEDIDELIYVSDCVVAPIFSWGWVKTKIVHAMIYNKSIITTVEGIRGIDISRYSNITIVNEKNALLNILNLDF